MMRKRLLFSFLLLFALVLAPSLSLADDGFVGSGGGSVYSDYGVKYTAVTHDGGWTGFLVKAADSWSAAVYACGGDPARISAEVRSKLSDPNYGGAFYMYATNYAHIMSVYEIPEFVPMYVLAGLGISGAWHGEFGDMMLWYADTPNSLLDSAMVDFRRVLAGDDLGGGGSGGDVNVSDCVVLQCQPTVMQNGVAPGANSYANARNATIDSSGNVVLGSGYTRYSDNADFPDYTSSVRFYVPSTVFENLTANYAGKKYLFALGMRYTTNNALAVLFVADDFSYVFTDMGNIARNVLFFTGDTYYSTTLLPAYHDSQGVFFVVPDFSFPLSAWSSDRDEPSYTSSSYDVVSAPSGTWPEPSAPVTPDPPEIPSPTAPTVTPDPTPTEPTVVWPTAPIVVNPPEVTVEVTPTGLDYTELLTRINDNLNSIDSYAQAINSGLNSLRPDIIGGFDDVVSAIRNIYTYLQHFDSLLERHCKHIRDSIDDNVYELELYLKDLLQWLAAQLNYDNLYEYDDSTVTTLLYRILQKIPGGNGPVTYKPNPQSDEPGFFDWLSDLWHRFLIDLLSVLPDELGGLVNAFSQLTHYFPFSIPWDLFALFALFEHEPVTPVFDIPWGYGGESGDVQMIRIDLSVWDGVMSMIRPVFIVGFCFKLALITKDLLSNFDINKGGI